MKKIKCNKCKGTGFNIKLTYFGEKMCYGNVKCDDCGGKGYIKTNDCKFKITEEYNRLEKIGEAFEKAYKDNYRLIKNPYNAISNEFFSIEELLDWAKEGV